MDKLFSSKRIEARKSPIHGWGVFSKSLIKKGDVLEQSHGMFIERSKYEASKITQLYCNAFAYPKDDAHSEVMVPFGLGCVFNTLPREKCNADWYFDETERIIVFYAIKDINPDEEIFIDYYNEMLKWEKLNLKI